MARRRHIPDAELDLIPVLSLIVHIVPMLLLNVRFVELSSVPVGGPVVPTLDAPSPQVLEEQDKNLVSVRVEAEGFVVGGVDGDPRVPCNGICGPGTYDYVGLRNRLQRAKQLQPAEQRVVIVPRKDTAFEVLVGVMDACRQDGTGQPLFPQPLLAGPSGKVP
jgi:biopolymer transport protein ExbD